MNYLQDVVLNVEKNQGKLLNLLIESKIVDLELATKEVIKSNDAEAIYYFARYIKNADKKVLAKKIISTNNAFYICEFAFLEGVLPDILIDKIISLKDGKYIYYLAKNLKSAPIEKLSLAMLNTANPEFIYFFLLYVPNVPIKMFINHLMNLGSYEYIAKLIIFYDNSQTQKEVQENSIIKYLETHYLDLLEYMKTCPDILPIKSLNNLKSVELQKIFLSIYLNLLNDEEKLKALKELYINNDWLAIKENKDIFSKLFKEDNGNYEKVKQFKLTKT